MVYVIIVHLINAFFYNIAATFPIAMCLRIHRMVCKYFFIFAIFFKSPFDLRLDFFLKFDNIYILPTIINIVNHLELIV